MGTQQQQQKARLHTKTVGKEKSIHVDVPALVHEIHLGSRRGWRRGERLREHVDALSLNAVPEQMPMIDQKRGSHLSRIREMLGTHLVIYGLQDPTHDGGLTLRGSDLVIPNLVTNHPEPRAVGIVHADVCPIRLTGVVRPKTCPAHSNIRTSALPRTRRVLANAIRGELLLCVGGSAH